MGKGGGWLSLLGFGRRKPPAEASEPVEGPAATGAPTAEASDGAAAVAVEAEAVPAPVTEAPDAAAVREESPAETSPAEEQDRPAPAPAADERAAESAELAALRLQVEALQAEVEHLDSALKRELAARERAEADVKALADHDPLTGVASARRFGDRLAVAVVQSQRYRHKLAVVQLGLDGFDDVCRRHGRTLGDDLLRSVAVALEGTLRQVDTIGRLEGDEFTVLLPGIKRDEDIGIVADKLRLALRSPFSIGGRDLSVTASLGFAVFPDDGPDLETLLGGAKVALRRARERGGDTWDVHAPRSRALAVERQARESALRRALVNGELELYYQPVVECDTGSIVALEALLRWRNADRLRVAAAFVPLAELTGLAVPLGQWTLRHACLQAKAWRDAGYASLAVGVNVSARQLQHPALVRLVRRVLDETGLPPSALELELPETELGRNPEVLVERMRELKELGVRLALDDFGTGETALTHISRYPVDSIKVDRTVIKGLGVDKAHEAVATAAIALARARRIKVVAEGVETEAQHILLARWQCDRMQGDFCGAPASPGETERLLLRQRKATHALAEADFRESVPEPWKTEA